MNITKLASMAVSAILRNKVRSGLTMLGIIIGICSVIVMISLGQSSQKSLSEKVASTGTNLIMVIPGSQNKSGVSLGAGSANNLFMEDVKQIEKTAKDVSMVSPFVSVSGQVINGKYNMVSSIQGGSTDFLKIRKLNLSVGNNFTKADVTKLAKVCIIGQTVVQELFPDVNDATDIIGKDIRFNGIPVKIIGVLESKGNNSMGTDQDNIIIAPFSTVQRRFLGTDFLNMILCSASSEDNIDNAVAQVNSALRTSHRLNASEEADFEVNTQAEMLSMLNDMTGTLTTLLAAIASISLAVGGIGIMNIMYVTVTERTKEIGLRMALGARKMDIMMQFLVESAILSLAGGLMGILYGLMISFSLSKALDMDFVICYKAIFGSFAVCAATGLFFGLYPARKAANLDPINALRFE